MNDIFNSVKVLKSSDDCNKFSKSVSYETLVGETATAGMEEKQKQYLSGRSAFMPLTVAGTFASLLSNSAKVLENKIKSHYRDCETITDNLSRILKMSCPTLIGNLSKIKKEIAEIFGSKLSFCPKMTVKGLRPKMTLLTLFLAAVLSTGIVSESRAACSRGFYEKNGSCSHCETDSYGCSSCSYDSEKNRTICKACNDSHVLSNGRCVRKEIINNTCDGIKINGECSYMGFCQSKDADDICKHCYNGYQLNENNVCIADENQVILSGTEGCTYKSGGCMACATGYILHNGKCYLTSELPDCTGYSGSNPCKNNDGTPGCASGYTYNGSNCIECGYGKATCHHNPQTGQKDADLCKSGYVLMDLGGISACTDPVSCNGIPNMYFNTTENKCKYKPDGCKNVNPDGSCVADEPCWEGYVKNASGKCYKPVESCEEGKFAKEDQCVSECGSGYLVKSGTTCVESESCTGEYIVDSANNTCIKMPGCLNYADGACGGCENGYYKKDNGCVSAQEGCGSGYLEKDSVCISSANGCGAGYKDMGGFCNRIQYTPAEAAEVLHDDNTNSVTITFKK